MPSARYTLNIKPEDLIPDKPRERTKKEKFLNWLHYHKWHLAAAAAALAVAASLVWNAVSAPTYDYQVGLVSRVALPDAVLTGLAEGLAGLGQDLDGDGQVRVQINQYNLDFSDLDSQDPYAVMASQTRLAADLQMATNFIFLLDDPESFLQAAPMVLCYLDGSLPEEGAGDVENMVVPWAGSPASQLPLGSIETLAGEVDIQQLLSGFSLGFVGNWDQKEYQKEATLAYRASCGELWQALTGRPAP